MTFYSSLPITLCGTLSQSCYTPSYQTECMISVCIPRSRFRHSAWWCVSAWRAVLHQLFAHIRTGWRGFHTFRPPLMGVRRLEKTAYRTNCFSPTRKFEFSSWRMWGWIVKVSCVVCAVARCGAIWVLKATHSILWTTIGFVDERTGALSNTIESTWRHVKAFLNPYSRTREYILHLVQYKFAAQCRSENVDQFTKFLHIVSNTDWSVSSSPEGDGAKWLAAAVHPPLRASPHFTGQYCLPPLRLVRHGLRVWSVS